MPTSLVLDVTGSIVTSVPLGVTDNFSVAGVPPGTYTLHVTGSVAGSFPTSRRALSGTVGPGSYTLSVAAANACGVSGATAAQTIHVPSEPRDSAFASLTTRRFGPPLRD